MKVDDDDWIGRLVGAIFMAIASLLSAVAIAITYAVMDVLGIDNNSCLWQLIGGLLAFAIFAGIIMLVLSIF